MSAREPDPDVRVPAFDRVRVSLEAPAGRGDLVLGVVVVVALLAVLWVVLVLLAPTGP